MKEIMDFIEGQEYEILIGWLGKNHYGAIDPEKYRICINLHLLIAETFIHEFLHDKYPKLSEEEIIKKTDRKIKRLKVSEIMEITKQVMIYSTTQKGKGET